MIAEDAGEESSPIFWKLQREHIDKYGEDVPEIRNWKWGATNAGKLA